VESRSEEPAAHAVSEPEPEAVGQDDGSGSDDVDPVDLSSITFDPATWPRREAKNAMTFPKRPEYEVDEVDHHIVRVMAEHEGSDWNECRDSIAVARCLSRMQLAGILSHHSRAVNGGSEAPDYTHNPATWPKREPKAEYPDGFPHKGQIDYAPDEVDMEIAIAVRRHASDQWPALRLEICKVRQLTRQQTAWLGAHITRKGLAA